MDYWDGFADFVAFERAAGGPSPNLKLIKAAGDVVSGADDELAWLAGCYAAIYNTPGALALWFEWPLERVLRSDEGELKDWLEENRLPIHSNRLRTHGAPSRLARGARALAEFAVSGNWERGDDFDRFWAQVNSVPSIARYFGIKLAGTMYELGLTESQQYDIRARGAKNGRKTLALLYEDESLTLKEGGNRGVVIDRVERVAGEVYDWLADEHGLHVNYFQYEAVLCEFNQMVKGHRYPGKTSDADLDATDKVSDLFGPDHPAVRVTATARDQAVPEFQRSRRKRKHLLDVYSDHGYVWSDAVYSDEETTDGSAPALRSTPHTDWEPLTRP